MKKLLLALTVFFILSGCMTVPMEVKEHVNLTIQTTEMLEEYTTDPLSKRAAQSILDSLKAIKEWADAN